LHHFKALIQQVKECDYTSALPYLTAIYAKQASYRGATIYNLFLERMRLAQEREEALKHRRPWPPPGDEVWNDADGPSAKDEPGYDPRLDLPSELLLMKLNQELHDVARLYDIFIREKVTVTQTKRDAVKAPAPPVDWYIAREIWMIDRQIDAKTRLFMKMRVDDRNWRLIEEQDEEARPSGARPKGSPGADETRKAGRGQNAEGGPRPQADSGSDETAASDDAPAVTGPSVAADSSGGNHADKSISDPKPATAGSAEKVAEPRRRAKRRDRGPAAGILPLLVLVFALGVTLGARKRSVAGTAPQTSLETGESTMATVAQVQSPVDCIKGRGAPPALALPPAHRTTDSGPAIAMAFVPVLPAKSGRAPIAMATVPALRVKAGNATMAMASVPALRAKSSSAAIAMASVPALRAKDGRAVVTMASVPARRGGCFAAALQGFNRTEATKLLILKNRDPGPNPIRTHLGDEEGKAGSRR